MQIAKALALTFLLLGSPCLASPAPDGPSPDPFQSNLLAIGYHIATMSDFAGKPGYAERLRDPTGFLAFSADFTGDGRHGEARILLNPARDTAYVVVGVSSSTKIDTYVIRIYSMENINFIGIRRAEPASNSTDNAGITLFGLDDNSSVTYDYRPDHFVERARSESLQRNEKAGAAA